MAAHVFAAMVTPAGALTRRPSRVLVATQASAAILQRQIARTLAATIAPSAALVNHNQYTKELNAGGVQYAGPQAPIATIPIASLWYRPGVGGWPMGSLRAIKAAAGSFKLFRVYEHSSPANPVLEDSTSAIEVLEQSHAAIPFTDRSEGLQ